MIWGDNIYQRRAAVGFRSGEVRAEGGRLALRQTVNLDQAFEEVRQEQDRIVWKSAAVSNDRDGMIVDISEAGDGHLQFRYDDSDTMGLYEVRIPLAELRKRGCWSFAGAAKNPVSHPYMKKMGVEPAFFIEAELINLDGPLDVDLAYEDREKLKPGDYYYIRMEQLDTAKAWSSPVWVN